MKFKRHITRRRMLAVAASALGVGLYTWRVEPQWLELVHRQLPIANLPDRLVGCTLAQLSDLHIGPQVDDDYLIGVFKHVNKLQPDIVVYTGDFTSYSSDVQKHCGRVFPHLARGTRGSFGILGNHDYGPEWAHANIAARIAGVARDCGIQILRNDVGEVDGLQIVGLDDLWAGRFEPDSALAGLNPTGAAIVLSHNPDTADRNGWGTFAGWILAGHTHGGQCKPPFLPPPLLPVRNRRYTSGAFSLSGGRHMYISRGVGHLLRVRFNARPEVTLFKLVRA